MMKLYKVLFCLSILFFSCSSKINSSDKIKYGGIIRTLSLLDSSNELSRNEVNILFYGQSIVDGLKPEIFIDSLKKRFPFAKIKYKNKAIGGFTVPNLLKTSQHDLYVDNPDLIIFHAYDGIKDSLFDTLIRNIRVKLNSDILLFDHHYVWDKPQDRLDKINDSHDFDSNAIKEIAKKYNCGFVNVREQWKNYLNSNNIKPNELMGNTIDPNVHPNNKGNILLRSILLSVFDKNNESNFKIESDKLRDKITLDKVSKNFNFNVYGNRVTLETDRRHNKGAKIKILINDLLPSSIKSNYTISRPSKGFKSWMPAIKKVSFGNPFPIEEIWEFKILNIDRDNFSFDFSLKGSLTGFDGGGSSNTDFVSNSGRIIIKKEDFNILKIEKITKKETPENFIINFEVKLLVNDTISMERKISKYTIYRGLVSEEQKIEFEVITGNPKLKKLIIDRPYSK